MKQMQANKAVMHFDPDGVDLEDLAKLERFSDFLRSLEQCGAMES